MPIDFTFTEEQDLFRKSLRELMAKAVAPRAKELTQARALTPEVHKALKDAGIFGLLLPTEYGGSNGDYLTFIIGVEEMTKGDPTGFGTLPVIYGATCARLLSVYGSAELKDEVLPKVVKEGWVTPLHSTEPGCGTDFTGITTTAKKGEGEYVVNGEKICLTGVAEVVKFGGGYITSVKTRPELGSKGMSLLYIPSTSKGITTSTFSGMGVDIGGVRYEDTHVPERYLVGFEGTGYQMTYESFVHARVPTTMGIVAAAEGALEKGIEYIKQRKAFGKPVGAHEGIQFELAENYANIQACKWLCYRAAYLVDQYHKGKASFFDAMAAASVAKLTASEHCVKAVSDVLEWYGGLGTTTEYDIQQVFRFCRQFVIAEGTRHAQKIVIAMQLLGREFSAI
ncbi:MAG TPA: acyl-CoA dehydrogenase family protein [Candidatus Acidoferrales bacterium]|nr:acyl-CoA dehydrogenase family protein [Candidatus Acidoferrales bacterium]